MTLKLDDNGCCRIHSIPDDGPSGPRAPVGPHGNGWIVANDRYVVMPWKVVTRHMTLTEAVDSIFSRHGSKAKENERREREQEEIESKHKE